MKRFSKNDRGMSLCKRDLHTPVSYRFLSLLIKQYLLAIDNTLQNFSILFLYPSTALTTCVSTMRSPTCTSRLLVQSTVPIHITVYTLSTMCPTRTTLKTSTFPMGDLYCFIRVPTLQNPLDLSYV